MNNLFFIDTETGGLKSYVNGLCSAYIKKFYSTWDKSFIFYPQNKVYEMQAFDVNHFDMKTLYEEGCSRFELVNTLSTLSEIQGQQGYIILAGWNVMFDIEFILNIYKEKNLKLPCPIVAYDLKEIACKNIKKKDGRKKEDDGVENYKLTTIYQHFFDDFDEEKAHTAKYDVEMCEKLYIKFKELGWCE